MGAFAVFFSCAIIMVYIWPHPSHLVLVNRTSGNLEFKAPGCDPSNGTVKRAGFSVVQGPSSPPIIEYSGQNFASRTVKVTSETVSIKEPGNDNVYVLELR